MTQEFNHPYLTTNHPDVRFYGEQEMEETGQTNEGASRSFDLKDAAYYIGRDPKRCSIIIAPERHDVRRTQARIRQNGSHYILEDNASPYGTFVNGKRISEPYPLYGDEVIGFGITPHMLVFNAAKGDRSKTGAGKSQLQIFKTLTFWIKIMPYNTLYKAIQK